MEKRLKERFLCFIVSIFIIIVVIIGVFSPKKEFSSAERRKFADFPKLSVEEVLSGKFMKEFEKYTLDHFPFRETFRNLKSATASHLFLQKDLHKLYLQDGYICAMEYPMNEDSIQRAASRFHFIYEQYLSEDNQVYLSVIPDKNLFLAKKSGHLSMDYAKFEKEMQKRCGFATYLPISPLLKIEDYYKTDTHLRQEKIGEVAEFLLEHMHAETGTEDYKIKKATDDFYGVYHGQLALPQKPESLYYLENEKMKEFQVYDGQNQKEIPLYDLKKAEGKDPYELFLGGPLSLVTIENPHAKSDRNLVVFRDSFASAIAPLLAEGYAKVTLVDIRYIHPSYLEQFVSFDNADVLFLYSTLVLNNSSTIK